MGAQHHMCEHRDSSRATAFRYFDAARSPWAGPRAELALAAAWVGRALDEDALLARCFPGLRPGPAARVGAAFEIESRRGRPRA